MLELVSCEVMCMHVHEAQVFSLNHKVESLVQEDERDDRNSV
jgi:hypothetical protein